MLLPNLAPHLGLSFALSHLAAAFVLLPVIPRIVHAFELASNARTAKKLARAGDAGGVVHAALLAAIRRMSQALESTAELWRTCSRHDGRSAEHGLADARAELTSALGGPMRDLPPSLETDRLGRVLLACLQLRRAIEVLLLHAERFVDDRIAVASSFGGLEPGAEGGDRLLERMHALIIESLAVLAEALETRRPADVEEARAREIAMNGIEARARACMLVAGTGSELRRVDVPLLDLIDAYEAAGNQAYRLAETLGESYSPKTLVEAI